MNFRTSTKKLALKLFEFHKTIISYTFLFKKTQFEKTGSIGKFFSLRWEIWKSISENSINHFILWFSHFCCSTVEFAFLLTKKLYWTWKVIKHQNTKNIFSVNKF